MRLSLRRRLFLAMVGLGTMPLAFALVVLALQVGSTTSPTGFRATLDDIAERNRALTSAIDTTVLEPEGRAALAVLTETVGERTRLARRAEAITRTAAGWVGLLVLMGTVGVIGASLVLARRWAREVSAPIEELVDWTRRIEEGAALPAVATAAGPPEFDDLRHALRQAATALDEARTRELEQERLRAFRETARTVAHEMRGPLNAAQLALRQLRAGIDSEPLRVLGDELERLNGMAHEFSAFGRLPEGPTVAIDVEELVRGVVGSSVPEEVPVSWVLDAGLSTEGHYEPLRRAFQNVVRNAVESGSTTGIDVRVEGREPSSVTVVIADHGPGIPDDVRARVFEPYVTTKRGGTGLGLAMVHQTVLQHGGTVAIHDTDGGGATVIVTLPRSG
jgi:signal transduction histidine kinase